jgi:ABC-2 type transport system ATP-binding protein
VVIINKGKVVAVDTPDNLTARLRGSETIYLQVAGPQDAVAAALTGVPGVTRVAANAGREGLIDVEIDSEKGRDVRRDLASAVVSHGWGLLELRPMRMSLEDIFLSLTTEEPTGSGAASAAPEEGRGGSLAPQDTGGGAAPVSAANESGGADA